jgi:hypothetical protein
MSRFSLSVNAMGSNLTTQGRGFAQISAAAMDGDFTRLITVEANGFLADPNQSNGVQPERCYSEEYGCEGGCRPGQQE